MNLKIDDSVELVEFPGMLRYFAGWNEEGYPVVFDAGYSSITADKSSPGHKYEVKNGVKDKNGTIIYKKGE